MKFHLPLTILICFLVLSACKSPQPRKPVTVQSQTFYKESIKRNKLILEKEQQLIAEIIKNDTVNEYISSKHGFWYYYKKKDSIATDTPQFGDDITYTYNIFDLKGKALYSKKDLGLQTYRIDKQELFSGLREGLKVMKVGEEISFIFPSQLAYGFVGDNKRIGINVPLICNVTLESIKHN